MKRIAINYGLVIALMSTLFFSGCGADDPVVLSDKEELIRFVSDSEDGKELYSTNLYSSDKFYFNDSLEAFYKINSTKRNYIAYFANSPKDIFPYSDVYDAILSVDDTIFGTVYGVHENGNDTLNLGSFASLLRRYAYFVKQFNDGYNYKGWVFWGYSCDSILDKGTFVTLSGAELLATPTSSANVNGSISYFREDDIARLPTGDSIQYTNDRAERMFAENSSSVFKTYISEQSGSEYTTGWRIPSSTNRFFHLITFDGGFSINVQNIYDDVDSSIIGYDSTLIKRPDHVIPFKINF